MTKAKKEMRARRFDAGSPSASRNPQSQPRIDLGPVFSYLPLL